MDIQFKNASGVVTVADKVFGTSYNQALVHQVVVSFMASARAGTKAQKTRSEVSGGGAKPWKQKGTGRARAGTIRSPLWRTGGVTFATKPRDYTQKVNRKMYRSALCSIFSELYRQDRLIAIEKFSLSTPKTKVFLEKMKEFDFGEDILLVLDNVEVNVYLGSRNIPKVTVVDVNAIDPVLLLRHEKVAIDKAALEKISEWLS